MQEDPVLSTIIVVVGLVFIASISAIFMRRAHFPYTIGLLLVGILVGYLSTHVEALAIMQNAQLTPDIILFLILPTLLFEASININSKMLLSNLTPILLLSTVGLLISTAIVGVGISAATETTVYIVIGFLLTLVARFAVIYGLIPLANSIVPASSIKAAEQSVIFWGGLRGAVPLALVLGLPADFEHRVLIIDLTLGVVLMSLLLQGTTIGWLLRRLKLIETAVTETRGG